MDTPLKFVMFFAALKILVELFALITAGVFLWTIAPIWSVIFTAIAVISYGVVIHDAIHVEGY